MAEKNTAFLAISSIRCGGHCAIRKATLRCFDVTELTNQANTVRAVGGMPFRLASAQREFHRNTGPVITPVILLGTAVMWRCWSKGGTLWIGAVPVNAIVAISVSVGGVAVCAVLAYVLDRFAGLCFHTADTACAALGDDAQA
jgi:hypothetical protein